MELVQQARARLHAWIEDVPGGSVDSFQCDPYSYTVRYLDTGVERPPPAWGGSRNNPVGRLLNDAERTEADSCLPFVAFVTVFGVATNE